MKKTLEYYMKRYEKDVMNQKATKELTSRLNEKDALFVQGLIGSAFATGALFRGYIKKEK